MFIATRANIPVPWNPITLYYPRVPRKIPAYKRIITAEEAAHQPPPTLSDSQLVQLDETAKRLKEDARLEANLGTTLIPHKILTPMELRSRAIALMNERGYDPVRELIRIARNATTDERMRVDIHKYLTKFVYPEQKSVDMNIQGDLNVNVTVMKFTGASAPNREAIPVRAVEIAS